MASRGEEACGNSASRDVLSLVLLFLVGMEAKFIVRMLQVCPLRHVLPSLMLFQSGNSAHRMQNEAKR